MNKLRKVVSSTVISLIGQTITWASTFLLTIAYGRFLGDVKFGELYFALTFVLLIGFPLEFGFNQQLTRDIAQEPEKAMRYLANTLTIKVVLWLFLYGGMLIVCYLLNINEEERTLITISGFILLSTAIGNTFAALHYAFERVVYPVVGTVLEKGLGALVGFFVLKEVASVEAMAFILLGGSLANSIWQATWFLRLVGTEFTLDWQLIRSLVKTSIPFFIFGVLGVIYYRIDTVLLSFMARPAVVGWYGAGYQLFDTMVFLPNLVIMTIMYPVFSKFSLQNTAHLKLAIEKSMNFLLFCGIPIATAMLVAAPNIIGFLYHRDEFVPSYAVLQGLAPGVVFLYINTVLSTTLMSIKQEKKITLMAAAALVFNLSLNLLLIPRFLHVGAAIVTSLTELLLMCIAITLLPRDLLPRRSLLVGGKALLASIVMAIVIHFIDTLNILEILPIAILVYLGVATLIGTIPREDLLALSTAIRQKAVGKASQLEAEQLAETTESTFIETPSLVPVEASTLEDTLPRPAVKRKRSRETTPFTPVPEAVPLTPFEVSTLELEDTVPLKSVRKAHMYAETRPQPLTPEGA
jgi:O-antigen/teichoic acid export membrane protein